MKTTDIHVGAVYKGRARHTTTYARRGAYSVRKVVEIKKGRRGNLDLVYTPIDDPTLLRTMTLDNFALWAELPAEAIPT